MDHKTISGTLTEHLFAYLLDIPERSIKTISCKQLIVYCLMLNACEYCREPL